MKKGRLPGGQTLDNLNINTVSLLSSMKMATFEQPIESAADATVDVGEIWSSAIIRYEKDAMVNIESLARASDVDEILSVIREREKKFKGYRHDGSKLDRFRTLVSKSLSPIDKLGNIVASAVSTVRVQPLSCSSFIDDLYLYCDSPSLPALLSSQLSVILSTYDAYIFIPYDP